MESINQDNYWDFPAVNNSALSWLEEDFMDEEKKIYLRAAYANGTLIDCMITEPHRVNLYKNKVLHEDYNYTAEEFANAKKMKAAADKDPFLQMFMKDCHFQHITYRENFEIEYDGVKFTLPMKCKWDLRHKKQNLGGDIKSTTATTMKQCIAAAKYFEYDRSRALYMDLEGTDNDILIFISKVNYQIFKIPIKRGDEFYNSGKKKYQELAWRWYTLFGNGKD